MSAGTASHNEDISKRKGTHSAFADPAPRGRHFGNTAAFLRRGDSDCHAANGAFDCHNSSDDSRVQVIDVPAGDLYWTDLLLTLPLALDCSFH
jgi:hypothetical protein